MVIALIWFVLAIVVGAAAGSRGRSGFGWFALAVLLSPLIAGLIVAILPDLKTRGLLERIAGVNTVDDDALRRAVMAASAAPRAKLLHTRDWHGVERTEKIIAIITSAGVAAALIGFAVYSLAGAQISALLARGPH